MPEPHVASRLPCPSDVAHMVIKVAMAAICCLFLIFLSLFVCLCVLLGRANVPEVHARCPGFWDFMLASLFVPMAIPFLYCTVACLLVPWRAFYGACCLIMGIASLHVSLAAGENGECVLALQHTTEPFPWLLYAGYIQSALFTAGALSIILARVSPKT